MLSRLTSSPDSKVFDPVNACGRLWANALNKAGASKQLLIRGFVQGDSLEARKARKELTTIEEGKLEKLHNEVTLKLKDFVNASVSALCDALNHDLDAPKGLKEELLKQGVELRGPKLDVIAGLFAQHAESTDPVVSKQVAKHKAKVAKAKKNKKPVASARQALKAKLGELGDRTIKRLFTQEMRELLHGIALRNYPLAGAESKTVVSKGGLAIIPDQVLEEAKLEVIKQFLTFAAPEFPDALEEAAHVLLSATVAAFIDDKQMTEAEIYAHIVGAKSSKPAKAAGNRRQTVALLNSQKTGYSQESFVTLTKVCEEAGKLRAKKKAAQALAEAAQAEDAQEEAEKAAQALAEAARVKDLSLEEIWDATSFMVKTMNQKIVVIVHDPSLYELLIHKCGGFPITENPNGSEPKFVNKTAVGAPLVADDTGDIVVYVVNGRGFVSTQALTGVCPGMVEIEVDSMFHALATTEQSIRARGNKTRLDNCAHHIIRLLNQVTGDYIFLTAHLRIQGQFVDLSHDENGEQVTKNETPIYYLNINALGSQYDWWTLQKYVNRDQDGVFFFVKEAFDKANYDWDKLTLTALTPFFTQNQIDTLELDELIDLVKRASGITDGPSKGRLLPPEQHEMFPLPPEFRHVIVGEHSHTINPDITKHLKTKADLRCLVVRYAVMYQPANPSQGADHRSNKPYGDQHPWALANFNVPLWGAARSLATKHRNPYRGLGVVLTEKDEETGNIVFKADPEKPESATKKTSNAPKRALGAPAKQGRAKKARTNKAQENAQEKQVHECLLKLGAPPVTEPAQSVPYQAGFVSNPNTPRVHAREEDADALLGFAHAAKKQKLDNVVVDNGTVDAAMASPTMALD